VAGTGWWPGAFWLQLMTTTSAPDYAAAYPDGIGPENARHGAVGWRWLPLVVLGLVLALALSGALGGRPNPTISGQSQAAGFAFQAPQVLRNGEFFEMRITAHARRPIAKPVVAVSARFMQDLTINSFIPAASEEGFEKGMFTFTFEPLPAGESIEVKLDGQVNPALVGLNQGTLELRDDKQVLVTLHPHLRVLP
jgi:hypothetical protein